MKSKKEKDVSLKFSINKGRDLFWLKKFRVRN
jgi:hypothetical protein